MCTINTKIADADGEDEIRLKQRVYDIFNSPAKLKRLLHCIDPDTGEELPPPRNLYCVVVSCAAEIGPSNGQLHAHFEVHLSWTTPPGRDLHIKMKRNGYSINTAVQRRFERWYPGCYAHITARRFVPTDYIDNQAKPGSLARAIREVDGV
jgi:hypothetical protein